MNRIGCMVMLVLAGCLVGMAQGKIPDEVKAMAAESKTLFAGGKYAEYVCLLDTFMVKDLGHLVHPMCR